MTYRRAKSLDKNLVWAEYFNDEFSVRRNGGVPANVTFDKGGAIFSSDGYIHYDFPMHKSDYSIRVRFRDYEADIYKYVLTPYYLGATVSVGAIRQYNVDGEIDISGSALNEKIYVDGIETDVTPDGTREIVAIYTVDRNVDGFRIGNFANANGWINGAIESIEIYNKLLTAEEVANLAGI